MHVVLLVVRDSNTQNPAHMIVCSWRSQILVNTAQAG